MRYGVVGGGDNQRAFAWARVPGRGVARVRLYVCVGDVARGEVEYMCRQGGPLIDMNQHTAGGSDQVASGYPTSMHGFDDVFLKDTTTRRIVLADSTGPLVIVRSASEQWLGAAAPAPPAPPPPSPPLGGPPACAGAAKPSVAAASTNPAAVLGDMLCARRQFEKTPDAWA